MLNTTPTPTEILKQYAESERFCREAERKRITTLSRSQAWQLEKQGRFPKRRKIGNTNVWLLSDLLYWIAQQEEV
ncbi:helix-turn-helix transcriptional regulator [Photobacterium chitinilyticum]|uniref:AlpA family phage regulatory protein n=1 Tax=Photobacterium chitinilyticum TaxID=2485123 RepID=A0A3S3R6Y7_9GAMM|nr:AlpA family phage regulatory protein [Photobacterium chitinilyticum]RWX53797.1 AlpA family phage regulatory protein [Photobacterium chitinilyticum]